VHAYSGRHEKGPPLIYEKATFGTVSIFTQPSIAARYPLKIAEPYDGCSPLDENESYEGYAVLIQRGGCYFTEKVEHGNARGAAIVIIVNTEDKTLQMGAPGRDASLYSSYAPSLLVGLTTGNYLRLLVNAEADAGTNTPAYVSVGLHATEPSDALVVYRPDDATRTPIASTTIGTRGWAVQFELILVGDGSVEREAWTEENVNRIASGIDAIFQQFDSVTGVPRAFPLPNGILQLVVQVFVDSEEDASAVGVMATNVGFTTDVRDSMRSFGFKSFDGPTLFTTDVVVLSAEKAREQIPNPNLAYPRDHDNFTLSMVTFLSSAVLSVVLIIALVYRRTMPNNEYMGYQIDGPVDLIDTLSRRRTEEGATSPSYLFLRYGRIEATIDDMVNSLRGLVDDHPHLAMFQGASGGAAAGGGAAGGEPVAPVPITIDTRLGRIGLGRGSFGTAYLGHFKGIVVAVKVLSQREPELVAMEAGSAAHHGAASYSAMAWVPYVRRVAWDMWIYLKKSAYCLLKCTRTLLGGHSAIDNSDSTPPDVVVSREKLDHFEVMCVLHIHAHAHTHTHTYTYTYRYTYS
jgi:hypothetical protein